METKDVVIKRVGSDWVEYGHVSNPKEYFPGVKVGQTWRVTTAFDSFRRGVVVTKAVLIKDSQLTMRAADLGWKCAVCESTNLASDLECGYCETPRPSH